MFKIGDQVYSIFERDKRGCGIIINIKKRLDPRRMWYVVKYENGLSILCSENGIEYPNFKDLIKLTNQKKKGR